MKIRSVYILGFLISAAALFAEDTKSYNNNKLEITVAKGESFAPFKDGRGFWTYKVTIVNTHAKQGRTLNGKLVLKSGGQDISDCTVYKAVDPGATETFDVNCKYTAEPIEDFDLQIVKVYNKKM